MRLALVALLEVLHALYVVQVSEVLVPHLQTFFIGKVVRQNFTLWERERKKKGGGGGAMTNRAGINRPMAPRGRPSLTGIDADEGALGDVVQAADAPALVLGLEELQADLQAVLHQPVGALLGAAVAPLVALVDPAGGDRAHALRPGGEARREVLRRGGALTLWGGTPPVVCTNIRRSG